MADTKITALAAIATVDPAADVLPIVDISDTSMAASGTTKKITSNQILGSGGTATLASATITGAATVGTTLGVTGVSTLASAVVTGALTSGTTTLVSHAAGYTGKVGIGTATPNNTLTINGTAATWTKGAYIIYSDAGSTYIGGLGNGGNIFGSGTDNDIGITTGGATNLRLGTNNTERYRIDSTGISTWSVAGTTAMTLNSTGLGVGRSPAFKLDVSSATASNQLRLSGSNQNSMTFANAAAGASNGFLVGRSFSSDDANNFFFFDLAASALRLFIGGTGNIGIGTAGPSEVLDVNSGNVKLANGNLILGTSGKGIDFSATANSSGTMTSELLNDYEEGTWVGTLKGSTTDPTVPVTVNGKYTKIGRQVSLQIAFEVVSNVGALGDVFISGVPFVNTSGIRTIGTGGVYAGGTFTGTLISTVAVSGSNIDFQAVVSNASWGSLAHNPGTGRYFWANITYTV